MAFIALRFIDLAIFGTLGGLWIFGLVFIVTLYRWIRRYERDDGQAPPVPTATEPKPDPSPSDPSVLVAHRAA